MTEQPINFGSDLERRQWIIAHAEYFTLIRRRNRRNIRSEYPSLSEAELCAHDMIRSDPSARLLIYAVWRAQDAFVKAVTFESVMADNAPLAGPQGPVG